MEYYIHVDSKNRDSNLFTSGNSYVLHIPVPIKSVVRAELVTAKVPNSMYNITDGTNVFIIKSIGNYSIPNGFYSAKDVSDLGIGFQYLPAEGKFIFLSNDSTEQITINTQEAAKLLGYDIGKTYSVSLLANPPMCGYNYGVKSNRVVDMSLNEFVFLDIEEFRTPFFSDAKSMPLSGVNARSMFAAIPMDVPSSQIKTFKENTDFRMGLDVPRQNLSRLTVRWYDKNLQPLNFQGYENNSFILRVFTHQITTPSPQPRDEEDEERALVDSYIKEIKQRLTEKEEAKNKEMRSGIGKWMVALVIVVILGYFYISRNTAPRVIPVH